MQLVFSAVGFFLLVFSSIGLGSRKITKCLCCKLLATRPAFGFGASGLRGNISAREMFFFRNFFTSWHDNDFWLIRWSFGELPGCFYDPLLYDPPVLPSAL